MFKDYYKILGITKQATAQEIRSSYRTLSMKWHPDKNPDADVTNIMQDINEAYAILKDKIKRERYDKEYDRFYEQFSTDPFEQPVNDPEHNYEYSYDVYDDTLKEDIAAAREYAKNLVNNFLNSFKEVSRDAAKGAWEGIKDTIPIFGFYILFGVIIIIYLSIVTTRDQDTPNSVNVDYQQQVDYLPLFHTPQSWTKYFIANYAFSISVPNTVELRSEYDVYTRVLKNRGLECNSHAVVFQQKTLSSISPEAFQHYCRIMIQHEIGNPDDFLRSDQIGVIDDESKSIFRESVIVNLGEFSLLDEPTYRWIDINGTKAIEIKYRRSGTENYTTCCTIYLFYNYEEIVEVIVSYREQEKDLWLPDMDNVIKTFKWEQNLNTPN